jgi:hypothetical protein
MNLQLMRVNLLYTGGPPAVVEASGMAALWSTRLTANWHGGSIGKLKSFSLLFSPAFPVMPKSFPVIFHKESCQKPSWIAASNDDAAVNFRPRFSDFPCIFPCYLENETWRRVRIRLRRQPLFHVCDPLFSFGCFRSEISILYVSHATVPAGIQRE